MIIPHINLGQIGVVGDQNGQALPANAWTDSLNIRFTPLGLEKIAESTLRIPQNTTFQIFTTKMRNEQVYVFAASRNGLHMYNGEDWYFTPAEISPDTIWQFTHWGDTVIFNCPEYAPFMFDWDTVEDPENAQNTYFVPLPKWGMISTEWDLTTGGDPSFDTEARCERLIAYKSQLVAVGIKQKEPIDAEIDPDNPGNESPVYEKTELKDKNNVVWVSNTTSDPTYKVPEGAPGGGADAGITGLTAGGPPSWDYISPATLSVQQVVGAADGRYIAAEQLNESIIIYTATAAHALIFTGGQYVVQTRRLFQRGAAGPQCVVEFGNNHFVIDGDQLYIHDGSTATRVGEDMFDVEFYKRAVNLKSATLCHDPENREIWIYFDTNYGRKSCIYSYATGTFGWGDGEAKSAPITYASRGYLPQTGSQWGDMTQPWHELRKPEDTTLDDFWSWGVQNTYTFQPKILALTSFGIHQKEAFFANNRECWVERKAIDLDDAGINGWVIKHLRQYHMQIAGEGKVGIRTGWAESALAAPQWEKPTWLDDNGDGSYQADMRTTGRYLSLRFEFKEMGQFRWANGYMDVEVSGRR
jgi:hypothetical protein